MRKTSGENGRNEFCGGINRDQKHPIILAPHLHFLPLSSPDIIHDALIEIGHNMSGKLMNGTKTLKDKWQGLEGKLKFSKVDNTFQKMNAKSNEVIRNNMNKVVNGVSENGERSTNGDVLPNGNINGEAEEEEEIVIGRKLISNNNSGFAAAEILNLCHKLEGLENGHCIDNQSLDKFFETVLTTYNRYFDFVSNNSRKNKPDIKYFPFNQFLPEKYVGVVQSVFQNSLRSGEVMKRVTAFHNNSCLSALSVQDLKHPTIFSEVYPVHVLQADAILSQILVIFSEVLDPYSILQDLDGLADFPCRYLSWCAVMDRFQEGALQYFTKESYNSVNVGCRDWPLPLLLNAMFLLLRLDQVDPAVEMGRQGNVPIHSVSHVILKLNSHLTQSSAMSEEEIQKKCSNMFLSYVAKFCDNIEQPLEKVDLDDRGLLSHLEKCIILVNKDLDYSVCRCGFPKPPSARKGWRKLNGTRYPEVGKALLSKFWDKRDEPGHVKPDLISHTDGIKELCKLSGEQDDENFWSLIGSLDCELPGEGGRQVLRPGISESIEHLKKICSVVPPLLLWFLSEKLKDNPRSAALFNIKTVLILQLRAIEDLDHRNDQSRWAQIVELYGKISRGECCFCGRRLPSQGDSVDLSDDGTRLAMAMLRSLGATHTMAILRQYVSDLPHFMLNKEFYQACILSGLVDSRVEGCRNQVIEQVSNASSMFPLSSSVGSELLAALNVDTGAECGWEERLQSDTNHAWGVCVEAQGACALCSLGMRTVNSRLRAFRCGHTFHLVCLRAAKRALLCPLQSNS
ncbi:hypothetical protein LSTR_LSTR011222 [Laodelphax striatellus]|uniref:RING-type domain-containing protein n=1 Tax=Laodelphax striatellus TaxID=195883 RepID=A0A482XMP2_LAOST|nr:hypothetical protein LSTR_LSTR011222 [Laodelphax striatellus]